MEKFKKTARLLCMVIVIILASIGIGISGGIPIIPIHKKLDIITAKIELVEPREEEESESEISGIK